MFRRLVFFAYGCGCYLVFLATFLYAIAFVGGLGVPTRLDGESAIPLSRALAIDAGLLMLFATQHSVMARRWFKERWTRIVPPPLERSTYVLCASLALALLCWQWRPMGGVIWSVGDLSEPAAAGRRFRASAGYRRPSRRSCSSAGDRSARTESIVSTVRLAAAIPHSSGCRSPPGRERP